MHKLTKAEIMREVKDYIYITLGLISYSLGWAAFLLPYQITTGGTTVSELLSIMQQDFQFSGHTLLSMQF